MTSSPFNFESLKGSQVVVVGAGSGIGRSVAAGFALAGAITRCVDVDTAGAMTTAEALRDQGATATGHFADATDLTSMNELVQGFSDHPIKVGVSTVGAVSRVSARDCEPDEWNRVMSLNVTTAYVVAKAILPAMPLPSEGGALLFMSSKVALYGTKNTAAYSAAKGAVSAFVRQLAADVGWDGIRVNALAPSAVEDTPIFASRPDPAGDRQRMIDLIPLNHAYGRMIRTTDIAAAAVFLCSDLAKMITGQTISIDGGQGGLDGSARVPQSLHDRKDMQ